VFERFDEFPNFINTSTFREACGFKDEGKLFTLLNGLADGNISRKDFNKALADAKVWLRIF
jgi:hypothetical protein